MVNRVRALWRAARRLPVARPALAAADRLWWARTIRRAHVVDADVVSAQLGRRIADRTAIRHYVRGAYREGFTLNPLFMEATVSRQLSDADRVPALYAYLVNDPTRIVTSPNWDAPALALEDPRALDDPGGPLGYAWRRGRDEGRLRMFSHGRGAELSWDALHRAATPVTPAPAPMDDGALVVCVLGPGEDAPDLAMEAVAAAATRLDARVDLVLQGDAFDVALQARILAARDPRVRVRRSVDGMVPRPERAGGDGLTLYRGPGADVTEPMLTALAEASVTGPVSALWLSCDGCVVSAGTVFVAGREFPLFAGHPAEDARRVGEAIPVPRIAGPVRAWPTGSSGDGPGRTLSRIAVIAPPGEESPVMASQMPDTDVEAIVGVAGFRVIGDSARLERRPGEPRRWAVKTAAPAGAAGESWGETHFARGVAAALERLGEQVVIDARAALHRSTSPMDDVVLVLRGPHRMVPPPASRRILWIISHPDEITAEELDDFDTVFAASADWARRATRRFGRTVLPLLQCTDVSRFHPTGRARTDEIVFVGTARGIARPVVVEPLRAGIPVHVYGPDWRGYIPASAIVATGIPNDELPLRYETAGVVLNDHWPAMRREGFISNRLFDVVAAGGRAVSDDVDGIAEVFEDTVRTFSSTEELLGMLRGELDALFPSTDVHARVSAEVRRLHSFDARAASLVLAAGILPEAPLSGRRAADRES